MCLPRIVGWGSQYPAKSPGKNDEEEVGSVAGEEDPAAEPPAPVETKAHVAEEPAARPAGPSAWDIAKTLGVGYLFASGGMLPVVEGRGSSAGRSPLAEVISDLHGRGAETMLFCHDHAAHAFDTMRKVLEGLPPGHVCEEMPIRMDIPSMRAAESACGDKAPAAQKGHCAEGIMDAIASRSATDGVPEHERAPREALKKELVRHKPVFMNFADPAMLEISRCLAKKGVKLVAAGGAHMFSNRLRSFDLHDVCLGISYPIAKQYSLLPAKNLDDLYGIFDRAMAREPVVMIIPGINWKPAEALLQKAKVPHSPREHCHQHFASRGHVVIEVEGDTLVVDKRLVPDVRKFLDRHEAASTPGKAESRKSESKEAGSREL